MGRTLNLRATRCNQRQSFEGTQPDSKLVGGLMRLVQALSGATRTGFKLVEAYEKLDAVAASTLKEAKPSLKLEGDLKRQDQVLSWHPEFSPGW